ncbi:MAG: PadR family transcriptional regulator [Oscillospiraceae bacterium]|nr:PadR family transcriptional regulator [Oscillospiraceae bacterium]MDE6598449.1 PadR family transcriptional regulator [Oscillospiraceae bacterium]MDE6745189.1 PadR family transcriptional regulator [Oscillospiraceae bacterium]MDE7302669.1 PadR family transcriptional regulator [Oscillospiraceae bacterium]
MVFPVSAALLDALVLSVVAKEDTYGYKITQEIREAMEMSESTLYPVLRRLLKSECLTTYDQEYLGRNRRYYQITDKGKEQLKLYREEWLVYRDKINNIISEQAQSTKSTDEEVNL